MPFPAKTSSGAIIQSAADLIKTDGLAALSMRTLAGRLGVRASSLYRHFPDRSAIERTLASRAAEELLDAMQQSLLESTGQRLAGEQALLAAAKAYLDYATTQQSFYDLLMQHGIPSPMQSEKTRLVWDFLVRIVSETTHLSEDASGAAALWSFLHGISALSRLGLLGDVDPASTLARGTQALIRGLSTPEPEIARSHTQG